MSETSETNITKLIKFIFLLVGIRITNFKFEVNFPYILPMIFLWIISFILTVLNTIHNYHNYIMDDVVDALCDIFIGMLIMTCVTISVYQRHNYWYVHKSMEEGLYTYETQIIEDEETIRNKYLRKSKRIVYVSAISLVMGSVSKFVTPFFFGIHQIMYTKGEIKLLPLPFSCWFPFSIDTLPRYIFAYVVELGPAAFVTFIIFTLFSLEFLSIMNILCEIEILSQSIRKMEETALLLAEETPSLAVDMQHVHSFFKSLAKQAVRHHEQIIIYIRRLNCLFGMLFFAFVQTAVVFITVSSYRISVDSQLSSPATLFYFGLMIGPTLGIWLHCWMGQLVIDAGDELRNALYSLNWPELPLSFSKDLLIMGEILNKPLCLKVAGIYVLDLETFTTVLQATYSYFNVLRSLRFPDSP